MTAVEDEAQSGKAQSGKEETGAQQRLQVEERRRSGKAAKKKAFAAAAARRLAARGCATGRQAPALAALMRGVGTSHPAHGGRWGGQLLDEGASSDKLIIKEDC